MSYVTMKQRPSQSLSTDELIEFLRIHRRLLSDRFGVTHQGIFGSFSTESQTKTSDIDIVVDFERGRKSIHSFLRLKRFLEQELSRKIDLGFEHSLKPAVRETIKGRILYV